MANLFSKILCPIDFHDNSLGALDLAAKLAKDYEAKLYLMHVVFGALTADVEALNRHKLETIARERLDPQIRHEILIANGDPADAINETAGRLKADLIAMASHAKNGVAHMFLGSVADRVMRGAQHPVLVTRPVNSAG